MKHFKSITGLFSRKKTGRSGWIYSIRTRLIGAVAIMIIPIFFLGLFSCNSAFKSIRQTAENSIADTIIQFGKYFRLSLAGIASNCNQVVMSDAFIQHLVSAEDDIISYSEVNALVKGVKRENAFIDDIIILLKGKRPILASDRKVEKTTLENIGKGRF